MGGQAYLFDGVMGVNENHLGRYERGASRPSGEALKQLADALGVSIDNLVEGTTEDAARADFEDRQLLNMFREIEKFDEHNKRIVKALLDAFIKKQQLVALAR